MPGGPSIPITVPNPTTASSVLAQAGVTNLAEDPGFKIPSITGLAGWEIYETAGSAAHVKLFDGTSTSGIQLADLTLTANGSSSTQPPANPIQVVNNAIFLQVVSGSVAGDVYLLT